MRMKRCQCWIDKYKHRRANKLQIQLEEDKFYILLLLTQISGQLHSVNIMNSINIPQIQMVPNGSALISVSADQW
jgi:hypothetical protein